MKKYIQSYYLLPLMALLIGSFLVLIPPELSAQPGTIHTIAGIGTYGYAGDGGPATAAQFRSIDHLAFDADGNLYISEYYNHRVRKIDKTTGIITTVAGTGVRGLYGLGGLATSAQLYEPYGVAFDAAGNMFIGEYGGSRILKVDAATGIITSIGMGPRGHSGDGGPAMFARFNVITDILFDAEGNLYIAEAWQEKIRKITAGDGVIDRTDMIETIAGIGSPAGYSGDGGPATAARLWHPSGLAMNAAGDLFIASAHNHCIRKVDANTGIITTIAGRGGTIGDGGPATSARLNLPHNMIFDPAGNLVVADYGHQRIRMIDANGIITTIAGTGAQGHTGDGGPAIMANISYPVGIAINNEGNIFFSENHASAYAPFHYVRMVEGSPLCSDPVPGFATTSECEGDAFLFTDLSSDIDPEATYSWDIDDDGVTDYTTVGNITHTYAVPGTYTARLTINQGDCSASATQTVTVFANPTVDAGANQTVYYGYPDANSATANLNATASGGEGPYSYTWAPATGLDNPNIANPVATLGNVGETYTVTITDANGCTASDIVTVCVNDLVCKVMNKNYKVNVCHTDENGNQFTLCVSISSVASHLAHGDQLGTCESVNEPCVDPTASRKALSTYSPWKMKVYPNPFQLQTRVTFYASENENIRIDALNMNGQKVRDIFDGTVEAGQLVETVLDGEGLPNGLYLIRLTTPNEMEYTKVMLMR